jgi:hypothetical protein
MAATGYVKVRVLSVVRAAVHIIRSAATTSRAKGRSRRYTAVLHIVRIGRQIDGRRVFERVMKRSKGDLLCLSSGYFLKNSLASWQRTRILRQSRLAPKERLHF